MCCIGIFKVFVDNRENKVEPESVLEVMTAFKSTQIRIRTNDKDIKDWKQKIDDDLKRKNFFLIKI